MEIRKTTLTAETVFGRAAAQAQMESAIPLPQGKTLERVLSYESEALVREVSCRDGAVVVTGTMTLKPVVESAEREPYAFEAAADFTHTVRLDGVTPDMNARVFAEIPACSLTCEQGGLLMQATVELRATVFESQQIPCIVGIDGVKGLEQLTETVTLKKRVLLGAAGARIGETINAPQSAAVLKASAVPLVTGLLRGTDGMRAEGELKLCVLFRMPDGGIRLERSVLPFSEQIACEPGENAAANATLKTLSVVIEEDGTATVDAALSIGVYGSVSDTQRVLSDAYDEDNSFLCRTERRSVQSFEATWSQTVQLNETLTVPAHMKDAYLPLYASLRTAITQSAAADGRARIEGILSATVVYRDDDGMKQSFTQELPLSFDTEAKGDALIARLRVLETSLTGGGRTVGLAVSLLVEAEWYRTVSFCCVPELAAPEPRKPDSGMLVYFADADESLFSIGKRFSLPTARVHACNPDLCEPVAAGTPVLIFQNK